MLHDIFHLAVQNVAQSVDGVYFHVFVFTEPVKLGAVDVMVGVQVILGHAAPLHGFPQTVIFDHASTSKSYLTYGHYRHKIAFRIVCV